MSLHKLKPFEPLNIQEGNWIVEVTIRHESNPKLKPLCSYVLKAPIGYDTSITNLSLEAQTVFTPRSDK